LVPGYFDDANSPQLHCTILKTIGGPGGRRVPFSYREILASAAFRAIGGDASARGPKPVDLGVWDVDEVQICQMGSHGPENEYISCGGISVSPPQA
jgi:activating signal cointegrator complex subunit 1